MYDHDPIKVFKKLLLKRRYFPAAFNLAHSNDTMGKRQVHTEAGVIQCESISEGFMICSRPKPTEVQTSNNEQDSENNQPSSVETLEYDRPADQRVGEEMLFETGVAEVNDVSPINESRRSSLNSHKDIIENFLDVTIANIDNLIDNLANLPNTGSDGGPDGEQTLRKYRLAELQEKRRNGSFSPTRRGRGNGRGQGHESGQNPWENELQSDHEQPYYDLEQPSGRTQSVRSEQPSGRAQSVGGERQVQYPYSSEHSDRPQRKNERHHPYNKPETPPSISSTDIEEGERPIDYGYMYESPKLSNNRKIIPMEMEPNEHHIQKPSVLNRRESPYYYVCETPGGCLYDEDRETNRTIPRRHHVAKPTKSIRRSHSGDNEMQQRQYDYQESPPPSRKSKHAKEKQKRPEYYDSPKSHTSRRRVGSEYVFEGDVQSDQELTTQQPPIKKKKSKHVSYGLLKSRRKSGLQQYYEGELRSDHGVTNGSNLKELPVPLYQLPLNKYAQRVEQLKPMGFRILNKDDKKPSISEDIGQTKTGLSKLLFWKK